MPFRKSLITAAVGSLIIVTATSSYDWIVAYRNPPHIREAPAFFCRRWSGITLPPAGIFLCPGASGAEPEILKHGLVHWQQYKRFGTIGFYVRYVFGWVASGFSYGENWMEAEARELGEFLESEGVE